MRIENNQAYIREFIIDLNKQIGQGQSGKVFECISTQNNNIKYCAKIITIDTKNEKFCKREQEISKILQFNRDNPNIVSVFHAEYFPSLNYFVIIMERCDSNLQIILQNKKKFNEIEINQFIIQFLNGYKVLYNKDIIHKDIKPENILIKIQNGNIIYKIADFGLSKIYKYNQNSYDISRNGTPAYSAPEVSTVLNDYQVQKQLQEIKNIQHPNSQIDIFSLGVILYQMIFGKYPFELTVDSIENFYQSIKRIPLKLAEKPSQHIQLVENILVYNPKDRHSFEQLFKDFGQNNQLFNYFGQNNQPQKINFQNNIFQKFNAQDINKRNQQNNQFEKNDIQKNVFIPQNNIKFEPQKNNQQFPIQNLQFQNTQIIKFNPPQSNAPQFNAPQFNPPQSNAPQLNPNAPQFKPPQLNALQFKLINKQLMSPHQQIKEFLNYLICDFQNALNDPMKQLIKDVNLQFQINQFMIKELQQYFPFELQKIHNYDQKTLKFQYSLICLLKNPQCLQINFSNIFDIKNDLKNFYQKQN